MSVHGENVHHEVSVFREAVICGKLVVLQLVCQSNSLNFILESNFRI